MYFVRLCIVIGIFQYIEQADAENKCLRNTPELFPKKYLHYDGQLLNITIESSNRVQHQLASHILKIILVEALGYPNVQVYTYNGPFDVASVIRRVSGPIGYEVDDVIPLTMINLEVWVSPNEDILPLLHSNNVKECGTLTTPGRLGWFVPNELLEPVRRMKAFWIQKDEDVEWKFFREEEFVSAFDVTEPYLLDFIGNGSFSVIPDRYHCNDSSVCKDGMFTPDQCIQSRCALLLAAEYEDTKFVVDHIRKLKLLVRVVWLGQNLKNVLKQLKNYYLSYDATKSIVVLHWLPSDVIFPAENFSGVSFKRCNDYTSTDDIGCAYEMKKLIKFSWSKLEEHAPFAYGTLQRMTLAEQDFKELFHLYDASKSKNFDEVACQWIVSNSAKNDSWNSWVTLSSEKSRLIIGGIFPISGSHYAGHGIVRSAQLARRAINQNDTILGDHDLKILISNGECKPDKVLKSFIDYLAEKDYYQHLIGVLGPACSDTVEPIAGVSKHYKTAVISYSAEGASFDDREKYPYFFRTIGSNTVFKYVYLQLFKKFGWNRIAAIAEDGQRYTEYISHMQSLVEMNNISLIANIKFPGDKSIFDISSYVQILKDNRARIIIADVIDDVARKVMCAAHLNGWTMKNGYVWFLPNWLNKNWYDTDYFNKYENETVNCTTTDMINTINGYFSITHKFFASDDEIMQEGITVREWRRRYKIFCDENKSEVSDYAGFTYDAVWIYALAMDKLIKRDPEALADLHSQSTTAKLIKLISETDLNGVSGRINFKNGPSHTTTIYLTQWINNTVENVAYFIPRSSENFNVSLGGVLHVSETKIKWLSGKIPDDGYLPLDDCTVESLANYFDLPCQTTLILINVIVVSVVLVLAAISVVFIYFYMDDVRIKILKSFGIEPNRKAPDLQGLDIPRHFVVINRKISEGQFGHVYVGQAKLLDCWMPVAVKTLKAGSSRDDRLDFLSEAETMKSFKHENIITLLAVCTQDEPIYIVMEFMLYGDLKNYLIQRRSMATQRLSEEENDVSSKKLTMMMRHLAKALQYLANQGYVHRDIASRNCMINDKRVLKLGDFGMSRSIMSNGYYRFERKGFLPVRWMAPESLMTGTFSTASDVWSFAVVVYEVLTFGNFPFQGMSNDEVFEHVKAGNHVSIPKDCDKNLQQFMELCLDENPDIRPTADKLVEFMSNNDHLISPCLDSPIKSVEMENAREVCRKQKSGTNLKQKTQGLFGGKRKEITLLNKPAYLKGLGLDKLTAKEPLLPVNMQRISSARSTFVYSDEEDGYVPHDPANIISITKC